MGHRGSPGQKPTLRPPAGARSRVLPPLQAALCKSRSASASPAGSTSVCANQRRAGLGPAPAHAPWAGRPGERDHGDPSGRWPGAGPRPLPCPSGPFSVPSPSSLRSPGLRSHRFWAGP